jgi:hypothetical protein
MIIPMIKRSRDGRGMARDMFRRPRAAGTSCTCAFAGTGFFADVFHPRAANQYPCISPTIPEPDYFFQFQEASGSLVDSITPSNVLTQTGAGTYANSVVDAPTSADDWTLTDGANWLGTTETTSQRWDAASGALFSVGAQSMFCYSAHALTASSGARPLWIYGGNQLFLRVESTGVLTVIRGASTASGAKDLTFATLTPFGLAYCYDRRGAGAVKASVRGTGSIGTGETISVSWASVADGVKGLGFNGTAPPAGRHKCWHIWVGSKAETMMDRGGAGNGTMQLLIDMGW